MFKSGTKSLKLHHNQQWTQ